MTLAIFRRIWREKKNCAANLLLTGRDSLGELSPAGAVGTRLLGVDQGHEHGQSLRRQARDLALQQPELLDEGYAERRHASPAAALAAGCRYRNRFRKPF